MLAAWRGQCFIQGLFPVVNDFTVTGKSRNPGPVRSGCLYHRLELLDSRSTVTSVQVYSEHIIDLQHTVAGCRTWVPVVESGCGFNLAVCGGKNCC